MTPCVIKLDKDHLYTELGRTLVYDLLGDIVTRYEELFTFGKPTYPLGKAELLFEVLRDGYGLQHCSTSIGIDVIDLRSLQDSAHDKSAEMWRDVFAGRIMARAFASTLTKQ